MSQLRATKPFMRNRVETLPDNIVNSPGYRIEDGTNFPWWLASNHKQEVVDVALQNPMLENPEYDSSWYFKYFYLKGLFSFFLFLFSFFFFSFSFFPFPHFFLLLIIFSAFHLLIEHQIFIGDHEQHGPFLVSVIKEDVSENPKQSSCLVSKYSHYRAMIWLKTVR